MKTNNRFAAFFLGVVLSMMLGCASGPAGRETAGELIDDATITARIKAAMVKDPDVKATRVEVTTYKGEVQLSGFVDTPEERAKAAQIARSVPGVKAVRNDIRLRGKG